MSPQPFLNARAATGGHRICVSLSGSSLRELLEQAACVLAEYSLVELRLDSVLDDPSHEVLRTSLRALLAAHPHARLIATCRRIASGGSFPGSVADELAILFAAAEGGCSVVDLAVESAEELGADETQQLRDRLHAQGAALLISYHNFDETPDLEPIYARVSRQRPDISKIVSTATQLADNLAALQLIESHPDLPSLAICMGERGIPSRILGPRAGALFTFAAAGPGAETAPGQVDAATLRDLYRINDLAATTRIYGVAGEPIQHSLSPLVHNAAFKACGVDAVFLPLPTGSPEELLGIAHALPLSGISVTMPLKQAVLPWLDELDPLAAHVGACNTIVRADNGKLRGYNTDVVGVIAPLEERLSLRGARVLVRGAGGAARAAVFALRDAGAEVWIVNRTRGTAERLAAETGAQVTEEDSLTPRSFDVLLNAIPAGMDGMPDSPATACESQASERTLSRLVACAKLVFDMVYNPLETPLLRRARAEGRTVIPGLEMFVQQAAWQFELWTGERAPREEMITAALVRLRSGRRNTAADFEVTRGVKN